jgi:hypothetical protein
MTTEHQRALESFQYLMQTLKVVLDDTTGAEQAAAILGTNDQTLRTRLYVALDRVGAYAFPELGGPLHEG